MDRILELCAQAIIADREAFPLVLFQLWNAISLYQDANSAADKSLTLPASAA